MPTCPLCDNPIPAGAVNCPDCAMPVDGRDKDIRQTMAERVPRAIVAEAMVNQSATPRQTLCEPRPAVDVRQTLAEPVPAADVEPLQETKKLPPAVVFRPHRRPPMALVTMLDDGRREAGEVWRLRGDCHLFGRVEGETLIPHDLDLSARHAEIIRRWQDDSYQWFLVDLGSTNGTFLRVKRALLRNRRELLLGGRRYEFRAADVVVAGVQRHSPPAASSGLASTQTFRLSARDEATHLPRLVELCSDESGGTYELPDGAESVIIGRDAEECEIVIDDPFLGGKEARLFRDEQARWEIEAVESLNGIWVRVERVALESPAQFQLGEQRFRFEVL